MDVEEVGQWRFCPACGRPIMLPEFLNEDPESDSFDFESVRCSCCERPWIACPCTPMNEGECRSIIDAQYKEIDSLRAEIAQMEEDNYY